MIRDVQQSAGDRQPSAIHRIRAQASAGQVRVSQHAGEEMVAEGITLAEVYDAIASGAVLEDYPEHRRGPCCLLHGVTSAGRDLHVVCTTGASVLVFIIVYEPVPPKWVTPKKRGRP